MKLLSLAILAFGTTAAQAAPIANEEFPQLECFNHESSVHFCGCGIEGHFPNTLVRVDISNGQRIVTRLQDYNGAASCQVALSNKSHPACQ